MAARKKRTRKSTKRKSTRKNPLLGKLPKYGPHAFRSKAQAKADYYQLAEHQDRMAADYDEANRERVERGKGRMSEWVSTARRHRARASRLRAMGNAVGK